MIQCVGSRLPDNPNCSRICCQSAVKNALRILDLNPEARIFVLYRDMRTSGFEEDYFQAARKRRHFCPVRRDPASRSEAGATSVEVTFTDPILGRRWR